MESIWTSPIIDKIYHASLIGCGRIGSILEDDPLREKPCTHAGAYYNHPRVELTSLCDIDNERLGNASNKWQVKKSYDNYKKLLAEEKPDILSIATEIQNHHDIVINAAKAGIPVILSEKPVSLSLSYAQKMIQTCREKGSLLIINHERRFASDYQFAKSLINNNEIGELRSIYGKIYTGQPSNENHFLKDGGGPLIHDGTHLIDIIRFLTDSDIQSVFADMIVDQGLFVESTVHGQLGLENNGIVCYIEAGGKRDYFMFDLEIWGAKGLIKIGNGYFKLFKNKESQYYTGFKDLVEVNLPEYSYQSQFLNLVDAIVLYLDKQILPDSGAIDGYKALECIYAMYQSAITQKKMTLPLENIDASPLYQVFGKGKA